jgi:signal recognition particle receptor subunit beta
MVLFNYSTKELTAKIVYYGPGLCGKTTNLQYIHGNLPGNVKGKMLSLATKTDRTLFFDFLPIDLGEIRGMKTRVQLYTVPGQVFYNETRKLVLKGADGIVFVADSQEQMLSANAESFKNLEENLKGHGLTLGEMPHVIQFNKRDLPKLATIEQLNQSMNKFNAPFYESVATTGIGIQDTLKAITKLVLLHLTRKYDPRAGSSAEKAAVQAPAAAPAAPAVQVQIPAPGPDETQAIPLTDIQPALGLPTIAVAPESPAQAEPEPAIAASVEPAPSIDVAPAQQFDDQEIEDLVGEVEELHAPEAPVEMAAPEMAPPAEPAVAVVDSPFQIDESNIANAAPVEEPPVLAVETAEPAPPAEVEPAALEVAPVEPELAAEAPIEPDFSDLPDAPAELDHEDVAQAAEAAEVADEPVEESQDEVLLTQVADDQELFEDANIDVAGVAPGEEREIVIPVEMGVEGETKRFKLSVRLRLDPVD